MDWNLTPPSTPQAVEIHKRRVAEVRRIAVLRANAIGDFIFALPALQALRSTYPYAEIVLYGQAWHAEFLNGRPSPVDRAVAIPVIRGLHWDPQASEDPVEVAAFFAEQRALGFDLALQMHGGGRHSNPFVRRLGARVTAGLRTPEAEPLDRMLPYVFYQLEYLRWLQVVGLVGAPPIALEPHLSPTPDDLTAAAGALAEVGAGTEPLAALHPGAGDPRRRWPAAQYAALGDRLAAAGAQVVVTGAYGDEEALTAAVVDQMRYPAADLFGRLSLGGLLGLFTRCQVVVSNDSGPLHLARAAGAATVGIYWCGNMITCGPLGVARHRTAISWRLECPRCGTNTMTSGCTHRDSFVGDVTVEEVAAAALDLFETESREPLENSEILWLNERTV